MDLGHVNLQNEETHISWEFIVELSYSAFYWEEP